MDNPSESLPLWAQWALFGSSLAAVALSTLVIYLMYHWRPRRSTITLLEFHASIQPGDFILMGCTVNVVPSQAGYSVSTFESRQRLGPFRLRENPREWPSLLHHSRAGASSWGVTYHLRNLRSAIREPVVTLKITITLTDGTKVTTKQSIDIQDRRPGLGNEAR